MLSERMQRRIDALLDEADAAVSALRWTDVAERARAVLAIDATNEDAASFLKMADADRVAVTPSNDAEAGAASTLPAAFVPGRYRVLRLLGAGARKKVYLARDEQLGREVERKC